MLIVIVVNIFDTKIILLQPLCRQTNRATLQLSRALLPAMVQSIIPTMNLAAAVVNAAASSVPIAPLSRLEWS
jgi:hypothetical protein